MNPLTTLARVLARGGEVVWDSAPPRLRVSSQWAAVLRQHPDELRAEMRDVLRRAVIFPRQHQEANGGPVIPYFMLPEAPALRAGTCISCLRLWRCQLCTALAIVLGDTERLGEIAEAVDGYS